MSTKVTSVSTPTDLGLPPKPAKISGAAPGDRAPPVKDQADLRLIIEEDPASGSYIYKTLDKKTGEVIHQFPIEQVLRLKQEDHYEAGAIITARA
jgi:flagellar protein FlaG